MATKKAITKTETKAKSDAFAVIMTGGKQYLVKEGDILKIEKISDTCKEGDKVVFDQVLFVQNGDKATVGAPLVSGAKVNASVKSVGRNQKIMVIHYKQKSKYFKKYGHRQPYTQVAIESIK
jgi:large subunit ribosomal protein L21